jgi:phage terminase large subunit-like protein
MTVAEIPVCAPRFATARTSERQTLGYAAVRIAAALGVPAMPWQQQVFDTALEINPETGRFAYQQVICSIPRQSGKTTLCLSLILTRALAFPSQNIVFTAQTGAAARQKLLDDWLPVLDNSEFVRHYRKRLTNGHEGLHFKNGSRLGLQGQTEKQGHGQVVDKAVIDEAWSQPDSRLTASLMPAMITRPQPMTVIVSTAGTVHGSPFWNDKVSAGRHAVEAGLTTGIAYFEWSAPDDAPIDDPATWRACMPALGYTQTEEAVRSSFLSMPRREFTRAFLNIPVATVGDPIIAIEFWDSLADPDAPRPADVVVAVDVSPGSKSAAIALAGVRDELLYVSIVEHGEGTDWLVDAVERVVEEFDASEVVFDGRAAGPLLTGLSVDCRVTETSAADLATGCTFFENVAKNRRLRHRGEPELTVALDGAGQRSLGDGFAWSRKGSGVDISPLVAVTLGCWAFHGGWVS